MLKKVSRFLFVAALVLLFGRLSYAALIDVETAIIQEDYAAAESLAHQLIDAKPSKNELDQATYYLGLSQLRLSRYQEARDTFGPLMIGASDQNLRDKAYLGSVDSLLLEGQYPGALNLAKELLRKSPKSESLSVIYLKLARANLKLSNWDEAQGYFKKIINEFPSSLEAQAARQLLEEKRYFAVQVGSFLDYEHAQDLAQELGKKGKYAYIVETVNAEGKKFYRVRVGKLVLLEEAKQLESKLTDLGYPTRIYP